MSGVFPLGTAANPNWPPGYIPPSVEWNSWWSNKLDTSNPVFQTGPWLSLTGGTLTGTLMLAHPPTQPLEAATKAYVDAITPVSGPFLPMSGGVMTGTLTLASDPSNNLDAVTKQYSDANRTLANTALTTAQAAVKKTGDTMTGPLVLSGDPTQALGAATRQYADRSLPLAGGTVTGALTVNGVLTANSTVYLNTLHINPFNSWEWTFSVDASGNKFQTYRSGWYEVWNATSGAWSWVGPTATPMTLDGSGNLTTHGSLSSVGGAFSGGVTAGGGFSTGTSNTYSMYEASGWRYLRMGAGGWAWSFNMSTNAVAWQSPSVQLLSVDGSGNLNVTGGITAPGANFGDRVTTANGFYTGGGGTYAMFVDGSNNRWTQYNPGWAWLYNASNGNLTWNNAASSSWNLIIGGNGNCFNSGGTWFANSDARLKQDVQDYTPGLDALMQVRPRTFRMIADVAHEAGGGEAARTKVGVIAQEIEGVLPETVISEAGDIGDVHYQDLRHYDSGPLLYVVVNAIKELRAMVVALQSAPAAPA